MLERFSHGKIRNMMRFSFYLLAFAMAWTTLTLQCQAQAQAQAQYEYEYVDPNSYPPSPSPSPQQQQYPAAVTNSPQQPSYASDPYMQQQQQQQQYNNADQTSYYSEEPQVAASPPVPPEAVVADQPKEEEKVEGPPNLFNNLWNIAQTSLNDISAHHQERNENGEPNDVSPAVDLLLSTAGGLGNEVADFDPSKTRGKDTLGAVTGFFNNLGDASLKTIGKTAEQTIANITSDTWFQEKVSDGVSYVFGVKDTASAEQIQLQDQDPSDADSSSDSSFLDDGVCEIEWNANYMGELLNDGHETIVSSEGECCDFCEAIDECNAWVYCGLPDGCGAPYYKYGECYLKYQRYPQNKKAYERGISDSTGGYVLWTSGIVKSKTYGGVHQKSYAPPDPPTVSEREVIHVSDIPGTWYFNGIPHVSPGYDPTDQAKAVMKARPIQCGDYNLMPGVASYNKDYNMRIQTPAVTPGGMVLLLWSNSPGNTVLPSGYMGSPCGPLDLQIHTGGGLMWDQQISKANSDGSATFVLDGVNVSNGNKCTTFLYQYVDIATCKVSLVLDTRFGL